MYMSSPSFSCDEPVATHISEFYTLCTLLLGDMSIDRAAEQAVSEYLAAASDLTASSIIDKVFTCLKVYSHVYFIAYSLPMQSDMKSMRYFCTSLLNIQHKLPLKSR